MLRFHVDTKLIKELPDSAFPFRLEYIDADTGESLYDVTVSDRVAAFMMPNLKETVTTVTVKITWPNGESDEQTWKTTTAAEAPREVYPRPPQSG